MSKEGKIKDALSTICNELDWWKNGMSDNYNCKHIDCGTCLFGGLGAFSDFLEQYRRDKHYGNG